LKETGYLILAISCNLLTMKSTVLFSGIIPPVHIVDIALNLHTHDIVVMASIFMHDTLQCFNMMC